MKIIIKPKKITRKSFSKFGELINTKNKINYLKINIYPDGGISRIRTYGKIIK